MITYVQTDNYSMIQADAAVTLSLISMQPLRWCMHACASIYMHVASYIYSGHLYNKHRKEKKFLYTVYSATEKVVKRTSLASWIPGSSET